MTSRRCVALVLSVCVAVATLSACSSTGPTQTQNPGVQPATTSPASTQPTDVSPTLPPSATSPAASIEYRNTEFGFTFTLPASWEGYSIVPQTWEGINAGLSGDQVVEKGPIVIIRHPAWTSATPRQDIPIMVFTLTQWESLSQDKFHIGAAPIGPSELGRNGRFVFALPARYNYSFPPGFEEVESILAGQPLHPF